MFFAGKDLKQFSIFTVDFKVRQRSFGNLERLGTFFRDIQRADQVFEEGIIDRQKLLHFFRSLTFDRGIKTKRHDDDILSLIGLAQFDSLGKGFPARHAPGGPAIDDDDFPLVGRNHLIIAGFINDSNTDRLGFLSENVRPGLRDSQQTRCEQTEFQPVASSLEVVHESPLSKRNRKPQFCSELPEIKLTVQSAEV